MYSLNLQEGWMLRHEDLTCDCEMRQEVLDRSDGWMKCNVPCDVYTPLIDNGIIVEPLEADNSAECEWVEDRSWWFKKDFTVDSCLFSYDVVELVMDSLDAEADIFLNDVYLGHHRSAFYPLKRNISENLKEGHNVLLVRVTTGVEYFSEIDLASINKCVVKETVFNRGDLRRVFVRKPQYVFGWDWGPRVATCGIMGDVKILAYNELAIRSVYAQNQKVGKDSLVSFSVEVENLHPFSTKSAYIRIQTLLNDESIWIWEEKVLLKSGLNYFKTVADIYNAKLWWPNGMGDQPLYTIKVSIECNGKQVYYPPFKHGIRSVRLIQDELGIGESLFAFEINGIRTFCKGASWIPADSIYSRVSDEKYDALLKEAKEANFNMLRIWGGGLYEKTIFYEKCDEYGIMIWHDFMFACGLYPDRLDWFQREVEQEADYQTKRLRNHCSIVLWCGNNENQWGYNLWWTKEQRPSYIGGIQCYNRILPEITHRNCPDIPYWNSSPYGGDQPDSGSIGDTHEWVGHIFNGDMDKRISAQAFDKVESKFVSEFGYIGPCCKSTIERYFGKQSVSMDSCLWDRHNNTAEKGVVDAGVKHQYGEPQELTLEKYILYAGLYQGYILQYALESFQFNDKCSGSLFWMFNDCWGEVGWSIVDYYLNRKIAYYFVKRAFEPVRLILREQNDNLSVMGHNHTDKFLNIEIECGYQAFDGSEKNSIVTTVTLPPFSRTILLKLPAGHYDRKKGCYFAKSVNDLEFISTSILITEAVKELDLPVPEFNIFDYKENEECIEFCITTNSYAHAVHFDLGDDVKLSDSYFDMLPGEVKRIKVLKGIQNIIFEDIKPFCIIP